MDLQALTALQAAVAAKRRELVERGKNEAVADFVERIQALGVPLTDVLPLLNRQIAPGTGTPPNKQKAGTPKRRAAPIKYRNPENPAETWAGRGKAPKWLEREEATGRDRTAFLVQEPSAPARQTAIEDL